MTNKANQEQAYFHNYTKHLRLNNPTFNSHFVNDSMNLFTPQKNTQNKLKPASEYKSNFDPFSDKINTLGIFQQQNNYARYSKEAFEKNKSYLSQYGTNLLNKNSSQPIYQK